MNTLRVTVLRGGPSAEYAVSMQTGQAVLEALAAAGFSTKDIVITRQGEWLDAGKVRVPEQALLATDVVFNALHGTYGEDGEVQKLLQRHKIPFTGSNSFAAALAFQKTFTKDILKSHGIKMPAHKEVRKSDEVFLPTTAYEIAETFGPEYIIKPVASGSSVGITLVREGQSLEDALTKALADHDIVMVEEFIRGKEATAGVLEDFRGERIYSFPSVEIVLPRDTYFFDQTTKYSPETTEICPARFSFKERRELEEGAALVHETLGLGQYSRSDFIVAPSGVYFLEVNALPGLTKNSLYPKAAAAVGLDMKNLAAHLVLTAAC